ncbi:MAG: alpha/beta fold hydrolase [Candidatus Obscuribacterales bacterium]|nr:alpha/beta fold hydrolase [Candidatus Obscuribacterales bacterium]
MKNILLKNSALRFGIMVIALTMIPAPGQQLSAFALDGKAEGNQTVKENAAVERTEYGPKEFGPAPTIVWQSSSTKPRAVIVTLHGLIMHGGVFDSIARRLVNQGYIVAAPDMRGYGRWRKGKEPCEVSYDDTFDDILGLVKKLKTQYPDLPLFCVGESLGADMSMRVASTEPGLVDGLVLSSPAIKHRSYLGPLVANMPLLIAKPGKQIDLIPYIRKFASEDPRIIDGALNDPLVRKRLSASELVRSVSVFKASLNYAKLIPASIPILVMQGSSDRVVKSNAVVSLLGCLKSTDQTVRWFNARGHLLLETDYVYPDTMQIVTGWLKEHVDESIAMKEAQANKTESEKAEQSANAMENGSDQDKISEDMSKSRL